MTFAFLGEDGVGFLGEEVIHHTLDRHDDSSTENDTDNSKHDAHFRNHPENPADDAGENRAKQTDEEDTPFVAEGRVITQLQGLERGNLFVQIEIDGETPGNRDHVCREEHESGGSEGTDRDKAQQEEEAADVGEILLGEDGGRVDRLSAADTDDGFVETDGGADVEVRDPDSHHIEDDHQQERQEVLQTITDTVPEGLHDVEFLCCHK